MADLGTGIATLWTASGPDLDPYFHRVTGNTAVAHSVLRRLVTRRKTLSWALGVGFDVREMVNEGFDARSQAPLLMIAAHVRTECLGDERVRAADVTVTYDSSTRRLRIEAALVTADGPFRLVIEVSALTLEILSAGIAS